MVYSPALIGVDDFTPKLPLHKSDTGWIPVEYLDGTVSNVDLETILLDSHKIKEIIVENNISTVTTYRILLTIVVKFLAEDINKRENSEWDKYRKNLIINNEGFNEEIVKEYFQTYEDRFWLIHPKYPFLQDPSLTRLFDVKNVSFLDPETDPEIIRKRLAKEIENNTVSRSHPKAIAVDGSKPIWQLPPRDIYETTKTDMERIKLLWETLTYQRYAHPAVNKGSRLFYDNHSGKPTQTKSYPKAHSLRASVNYLANLNTLYQTLINLLSFDDNSDLSPSLKPEWEWEINEQGFLGTKGYNIHYTENFRLDGVRDSINSTHLSVLFLPNFVNNEIDLNEIKTLRRTLFDYNEKDNKGISLPFPLTWNPFVAHTSDGKILKEIGLINQTTALQRGSLIKPSLLPTSDEKNRTVYRPKSLNYASVKLKNLDINRTVTVFVDSADIVQEKNFESFTLKQKTVDDENPDTQKKIEKWINLPTRKNSDPFGVGYAIKLVYGTDSAFNRTSASSIDFDFPKTIFWIQYQELFYDALSQEDIPDVSEYKKQIRDLTLNIFDTATRGVKISDPLKWANAKDYLKGKVNSEIEEGVK